MSNHSIKYFEMILIKLSKQQQLYKTTVVDSTVLNLLGYGIN